jgi:release factor glutamine methyltransferase
MTSNTKLTIREFLHDCGIEKVDARHLLNHYFGFTKEYLLLHDNEEITLSEALLESLERLRAYEPIEYITRSVSFYAQEFKITPGVLIPRPETELLIDHTVNALKEYQKLTLAEIGVGSGIISIMLSKQLPNISKIIATDINPKAIALTKENITRHNISNISIIESSMLDKVTEQIDVIVSNPPYIANDYVIDNNLTYEPSSALFGGEVGDEMLKEIIDLTFERDVKLLACEMGYDQKEKITNYLEDKTYISLEFYQDYSGYDRGFILKLR